jgi:uncharacterized membrane protein YoaK (UPF0700 family)
MNNIPKLCVALILTFVSGLVDIVGYLGIYRFFTAHLTGTTVQLGRGLAVRNWMHVSLAAAIVGAFIGGSLLARALIEISSRRHFRRIASITLLLEAFCLVAVALEHFTSSDKPFWSIAALAAAMGIQTATMTGIGPLTVHTTFVTGMLNKLAQLSSHIAFRAYDLRHKHNGNAAMQSEQRRDCQLAAFLVGIWLFYVAGAVLGTWSFAVFQLRALFIAVGFLALSLVADQFRPIAIREEREQSES